MLDIAVIIVWGAVLALATAIAWRGKLCTSCEDLVRVCAYWRDAVFIEVGYLYFSKPGELLLRPL